jgi:hypothetical protein
MEMSRANWPRGLQDSAMMIASFTALVIEEER